MVLLPMRHFFRRFTNGRESKRLSVTVCPLIMSEYNTINKVSSPDMKKCGPINMKTSFKDKNETDMANSNQR